MKIMFWLAWLALTLVPVGILVESNYLIWSSALIATIFIIKIAITRCKTCGGRTHLYMRDGIFAKLKIGLPLGRCTHCGEPYIKRNN